MLALLCAAGLTFHAPLLRHPAAATRGAVTSLAADKELMQGALAIARAGRLHGNQVAHEWVGVDQRLRARLAAAKK